MILIYLKQNYNDMKIVMDCASFLELLTQKVYIINGEVSNDVNSLLETLK